MSDQVPTAEQSQAHWHQLSTLPRPRSARLVWQGRARCIVAIAAIPICTGAAILIVADSKGRPLGDYWFLPVISLGFALWAISFLASVRRQRRIFADGDVSLGKVIEWSESRGLGLGIWPMWRIVIGEKVTSRDTYEFTLAPGTFVRGCSRDYANAMYTGMPINVFYDPWRPSRNAILEGSLFRIDLPSGARIP